MKFYSSISIYMTSRQYRVEVVLHLDCEFRFAFEEATSQQVTRHLRQTARDVTELVGC